MSLIDLDSRTLFGTDIEYSHYPNSPYGAETSMLYPPRQKVRVIIGELDDIVQMSAPDLAIVTEGSTREQAWAKFLEEIRKREDNAWLTFDVGPTRPEEIEDGLDAPEDEDWSGLIDDTEA